MDGWMGGWMVKPTQAPIVNCLHVWSLLQFIVQHPTQVFVWIHTVNVGPTDADWRMQGLVPPEVHHHLFRLRHVQLQVVSWGDEGGGAGVKPVEKLVELISLLFISLSCSSTFPLEVGDLPPPNPYVPGVVVFQFVFQFSLIVVLTLPDAVFKFSLNTLELCAIPWTKGPIFLIE